MVDEPAVGIAGGEAAVAEGRVVARRLGDGCLQLDAELGRDRARRHDVLAADQLAGLLEDAGGARRRRAWSKARPAAGLPVMPEVPSEPPQTVPTISSLTAIGTVSSASSSARCASTQARPSAIELRVPPVPWMTMVFTGRPDARTTVRSRVLVEALAAERDQQHRADIGMGAEPLHHLSRHRSSG